MASLVNTFPQAFLEVLHHSLQHGRSNCCHFFPDVLFQVHPCPCLLFLHLALEIFSEEDVLRLGTLVPMNIEAPTKYPLSQDRIIVFEISLHSKSPMLYRLALHGNWNALSLARRALKEKFPMITVPLTTVLSNRQVFLPDPVLYRKKNTKLVHKTKKKKIAKWTWIDAVKQFKRDERVCERHSAGSPLHQFNAANPRATVRNNASQFSFRPNTILYRFEKGPLNTQ